MAARPLFEICCRWATVANAYSEYVCGFLVIQPRQAHFVMVIHASKRACVWMLQRSRLLSVKLDGAF